MVDWAVIDECLTGGGGGTTLDGGRVCCEPPMDEDEESLGVDKLPITLESEANGGNGGGIAHESSVSWALDDEEIDRLCPSSVSNAVAFGSGRGVP